MLTIIAGSRSITDYDVVRKAIEASGITPSTVISGTARGVDQLGERWAREHDIPILQMPANWKQFGKAAGYYRNVEMAQVAEALIAVHDGVSRGTQHMIDIAVAHHLKIFIYTESIHDRP